VEDCTFLAYELSPSDMDTFGGVLLELGGIMLNSHIVAFFMGAGQDMGNRSG